MNSGLDGHFQDLPTFN